MTIDEKIHVGKWGAQRRFKPQELAAGGGAIDLILGEDMRMRSLLCTEFTDEVGSSIKVFGTARVM